MYKSSEIATRINQLLKEKQLSQKDMLEKCELSKNAISSMLSRGSMLRADNLARIADYLECSIDYLMGRSSPSCNTFSLPNDLTRKYNSLPDDGKEEISYIINYKYEQYQKKRRRLLSNSESETDDGFHNMLA
ncbi:MAG: helix-turn-helix domain-containing protein [Lachnospiraceae bacterium]|nr:helix-turn-helix domain-containing protein [Lachnospiraceae bacterium]